MELTETGRKTIINRRLRSSEADDWLSLPSGRFEPLETDPEKQCFRAFLEIDDSLAYIASTDDEIFGGTALHRDHRRLAIGLVSLRSREQAPSPVTRHLVKSSLPFFRSASIREVDALVGPAGDSDFLPFPLGFELPPWTLEALTRLGFEEKGRVYAYRIDHLEYESGSEAAGVWDGEASIEGARGLIWRNRKVSGLSIVQSDLAIAISHKMGTLHTVSKDKETESFLAIAPWGHIAKADIFDTLEASLFETYLCDAFLSEVHRLQADSILMPLVGAGQRHLVESLAEACNGEITVRELTLLRKNL